MTSLLQHIFFIISTWVVIKCLYIYTILMYQVYSLWSSGKAQHQWWCDLCSSVLDSSKLWHKNCGTISFFSCYYYWDIVIIVIIVQENALLETLESTMEPSWSHLIQSGMNWFCSFFLPQHKAAPGPKYLTVPSYWRWKYMTILIMVIFVIIYTIVIIVI